MGGAEEEPPEEAWLLEVEVEEAAAAAYCRGA
jgi:hypothetical protein